MMATKMSPPRTQHLGFGQHHSLHPTSTKPSLKKATIEEIAIKFSIPDLRPALTDYIRRTHDLGSTLFKIGQRQTSAQILTYHSFTSTSGTLSGCRCEPLT